MKKYNRKPRKSNPEREARKAAQKELAQRVAKLSAEERQAMVDRLGAVVTCEGHALSMNNTCLVLEQLEEASMVGGFNQWKSKGRVVRKGETGLVIWIPTKKKDESTIELEDEDDKKKRPFILRPVFDISQTEELSA